MLGMQEEDIIRNVTTKRPGVVKLSCPVASSEAFWDKMSLDGSIQSSYLWGFSFSYNLSAYDRSAKFACHSDHLHSIIYVHPKGEHNIVAVFTDYPLHDRL